MSISSTFYAPRYTLVAKVLHEHLESIIESRMTSRENLHMRPHASGYNLLMKIRKGAIEQSLGHFGEASGAYVFALRVFINDPEFSRAMHSREQICEFLQKHIDFFRSLRDTRTLSEDDLKIARTLSSFFNSLHETGNTQMYLESQGVHANADDE